MAQLCDTNTKLLCTLRIHEIYFNLITEKKTINGFKYKVFFDCEKFEKNYGKKFEKNYGKKFVIPKNMRIIDYNKTYEYFVKDFIFHRRFNI